MHCLCFISHGNIKNINKRNNLQFEVWLLWSLVCVGLTNGKVPKATEFSASSLLQITLASPPHRSPHRGVLPERDGEPHYSLKAPRVPGWCVPLRTARQHSTLHQSALRIPPEPQDGWFGKISPTLTTQHVWITWGR